MVKILNNKLRFPEKIGRHTDICMHGGNQNSPFPMPIFRPKSPPMHGAGFVIMNRRHDFI